MSGYKEIINFMKTNARDQKQGMDDPPSTNQALSRLTSEVRRDPVHSTRYGRQRIFYMRYTLSGFAFQLLGLLGSARAACIFKGGKTTLSGLHSKSACSVAATYKPPMLVPRARLPAGAFHVWA